MKKLRLKIRFTTIMAVVYAMVSLSSCGNPEKKHEQDEQKHSQAEPETTHGHADADHSKQMNDTRKWLKAELGEKYNESVSPATTTQLKQGKEIYTKYCASCHGNSGKGDGSAAAALEPKPADFTNSEHSSFYSDQGRILIIKKGIKGTAMAGWANTLNEEEILSVYVYVNSLKNSGEMKEHQEHSH
ncbi:MAG: cytochrome c [Bacteroidia bacterium]|nr:cytochrome c [Bacteroidia bacterium]